MGEPRAFPHAFELVRGHYNFLPRHRDSVVCIGGFDSLHIGHQVLIERAVALASESAPELTQKSAHKATPTAVLFEPLPDQFFQRDTRRTQTLRRRLSMLRELGIRRAVCLRFNQRMADLSAEAFVRQFLVDGLAARHIVVGEHFRFGYKRQGTVETLRGMGEEHGFDVTTIPAVTLDGERVSSTRVRIALEDGDIKQVERCLGRPFVLDARVGHGSGRGAQLGFPTANLILSPPPPLRGVFSVDVTTPDGVKRRGVINAGVVPTFNEGRYKIEVHIPEFSDQLYSRRLLVRVLTKLRDERAFSSKDKLKTQIQKDIDSSLQLHTA